MSLATADGQSPPWARVFGAVEVDAAGRDSADSSPIPERLSGTTPQPEVSDSRPVSLAVTIPDCRTGTRGGKRLSLRLAVEPNPRPLWPHHLRVMPTGGLHAQLAQITMVDDDVVHVVVKRGVPAAAHDQPQFRIRCRAVHGPCVEVAFRADPDPLHREPHGAAVLPLHDDECSPCEPPEVIEHGASGFHGVDVSGEDRWADLARCYSVLVPVRQQRLPGHLQVPVAGEAEREQRGLHTDRRDLQIHPHR